MTKHIEIELFDTRGNWEKYARGLYSHALNNTKYGWRHSAIMKFFVMNSSYSYLPVTIDTALRTEHVEENLPETKACLTRLVRDGYLRSIKGRYEINFPEHFRD
jgi:hypothetical protein